MVTEAPEQQRERWISPHALLGATSAGSAGMTTAGLLAGPTGVAVVTAAGALTAGGIAAVRRFAPGTAEKLGLRKPDRDKAKGKSKDRAGAGRGRVPGGRGPRLGGRGLLGGRKRGTGTGGGEGRKRGAGLLGVARKVAGKGAELAKRGATAAATKGAGLLGSKDPTRRNARGRKGSGPVGGKQRGAGGPTGRGRGAGSGLGRGKGPGGKSNSGKDRNSGRDLGSRLGRTAASLVGLGARRLFGLKRPSDTNSASTGPGGGKKPKGRKKRTKGSGLLGGRGAERMPDSARPKDRKGKKDKSRTKNVPPGCGPRREVTAGQPDRSGRRAHGGTTMPDPFASRREAISGAAPLEIERANDLIDYVNHAPAYAEAQASRWEAEARAIREQIDITPEFADALSDFAAAQHQQVTKVREYGETFRRGHADRLAKLTRSDPREEKWDIGRNRG